MSSASAWDYGEPDSVRMPGRSRSDRRDHLRLVSTGAEAEPGVEASNSGMRITRRGRLTMTLIVTAAIVSLALTLASGAFAGAPVSQHTVTVSTGQTLSEVAVAQLPQLPMGEGVAQLQLANDLTSAQVHAGQVLRIPSAG